MTLGVPLLGLTLRFALKPLVETWLRLREAQLGASAGELEALRARVAHLEHVLDRARPAGAPRRPRLQPGAAGAPALGGAPGPRARLSPPTGRFSAPALRVLNGPVEFPSPKTSSPSCAA